VNPTRERTGIARVRTTVAETAATLAPAGNGRGSP